MEIICPAGNGTLNHTDCLECSSTNPTPCGYSYSLLKAIYGRAQDRSGEVHVTDITGCLRKAYFDKLLPAPERVSDKLVKFLGVAVHESVEDKDEFMESEIPVEALGIVGKSDALYADGTLLDFKTTRWMIPDRLPYGSHELQVNIYAHLLRLAGKKVERLFIQYVDMSGPTKCRKCNVVVEKVGDQLLCPKCLAAPRGAHLGALLVEVPMQDEASLEELIKTRVGLLRAAMEGGAQPPAEPSFLCQYCNNTLSCPEGMAFLAKS